jgi:hypothetical protein
MWRFVNALITVSFFIFVTAFLMGWYVHIIDNQTLDAYSTIDASLNPPCCKEGISHTMPAETALRVYNSVINLPKEIMSRF